MSLVKYEILDSVVRNGSLTRAAGELSLTQSAVSHAVASLEEEFEVSLLIRGRNGVSLTQTGQHMMKHVREVLRAQDRLEQELAELKGLELGQLHFGTFTSISLSLLPPILKEFGELYPNIKLNMYEQNFMDLEEMIYNGILDFTFSSDTHFKNLERIQLAQEDIVCVFPAEHPFTHKEILTYEDLSGKDFILPKWMINTEILRMMTERGFNPRMRYVVSDDVARYVFVLNGLGLSLVPQLQLPFLPKGISARRIENGAVRNLWISAIDLSRLSPAAKKFVSLAVEHIQKQADASVPLTL